MDENSKKIVTDYILNNFWTRIHKILTEELNIAIQQLNTALSAETINRTEGDNTLQVSINTLTDVTNSLSTRALTHETNIKEINTTITEHTTKLDNLDTNIKDNVTKISALNDKIDILNGEGDGSLSKAVANGIASIVADAPASLDTLKEISDWISSHETDATKMNSAIQANTANFSNYTTTTDLNTKLNGKANSSHTHDDRYYTESEINAKLSGLVKGTLSGNTLTLTTI